MTLAPYAYPYTVGDTAPSLTGAVNANLTNATAVLNVARPDGSVFSHPVTITAPLTGSWSADLAAGDLTLAGIYRVELQVTYASSAVQTFAFDANGQYNSFPVRDQIA